jgi:crotonobetainyl-CoA:carnitine CoA-transferase CaiB-like acyl-CoA transferase
MTAPLAGIRVCDVTQNLAGPFCAQILGDLGAEVIKVEEPGRGDFARREEPLKPDAPEPEQSLLFQYLNWNKRGVTLDLRNTASHAALRKLVEQSDVVIEAFRPGTLDGWSIGVDRLLEWKPNLVVTSVTNFGQTGPYAGYGATDLVVHAMGGIMQISGRVDREPLKHGLQQALFCAGLNAAYATLAAHLAVRASGGPGEHVDLSIHEVLASEHHANSPLYAFLGAVQGRRAVLQDPFFGEPILTRNGYLSLQAGGGTPFAEYADFLGIPALRDRFVTPEARIRAVDEVRKLIEDAVADKDANDLFLASAKRRFLTGFVQTAEDLLACPHLGAREFWAQIDHPATGAHRFPGELVKLSKTPITIRRRAPLLGEHNDEVLASQLSFSAAQIAAMQTRPASTRPALAQPTHPTQVTGRRAARSALPLAGLRVLDLSTVLAIPYCGALLADLGAEVIKIEAPNRLCPTRTLDWLTREVGPGNDPWNRAGAFQTLNRGKRSFVLNLAEERGREIFKKLVAVSDIIINNYTPRVLRGWGLGYEELVKIRPDLILLSNTGYGSSGPWSPFPTQGTVLENTMGLTAYTGYRGDKPWKAGQSYPDFITTWTALTALMAAVVHRKLTGNGQWIDMGMYQIGVALMPEPILGLQANGETWERIGNEDRIHVPSNVYPAAGNDQWLALSVTSDDQWAAFAQAIGRPDLAQDERYREASQRRSRREEIDAIVRTWTAERDAWEATRSLQDAGVPAGPVLNNRDLLLDPHLRARGFYEHVEHWQPMGVRPLIGRPYVFRNTPLRIQKAAPRYGEDNSYVMRDLLHLDEAQIAALYKEVITSDAPAFAVKVRQDDLEPGLLNGSIKEIDPDYRSKLGLGPALGSQQAAGEPENALPKTLKGASHGKDTTHSDSH